MGPYVTLTVKVIKKSGGRESAGNDYEAAFWFHDGDSTGWIATDGDGTKKFELWTYKAAAYIGVRSKIRPVDTSGTVVKFFQNIYQLNELKADLAVVFVFET